MLFPETVVPLISIEIVVSVGVTGVVTLISLPPPYVYVVAPVTAMPLGAGVAGSVMVKTLDIARDVSYSVYYFSNYVKF